MVLTKFVFAACAALSFSIASAQVHETPEAARLQAEAQRWAQEQKKREADTMRSAKRSLQEKEAEAKEYVGKTIWYLPNASASERVRFYKSIPPSSLSQDPKFLFTPLTKTSFVVTGVVMPPPLIFPVGEDESLLEIRFPMARLVT